MNINSTTSVYVFTQCKLTCPDFWTALFSEVGDILPGEKGIQIFYNQHDDIRVLVNYIDETSADKAISEFNYTRLDNLPIHLIKESDLPLLNSTTGKLLIGNLDSKISAQQLHESLQNFGDILFCDCQLAGNEESGFSMVQFRNHNDAIKALDYLEGSTIDLRPVSVQLFTKKHYQLCDWVFHPNEQLTPYEDLSYSNMIYVDKLPSFIQCDNDIKYLFSRIGKVKIAKLLTGRKGIIEMISSEGKWKAVNSFKSRSINGSFIHCIPINSFFQYHKLTK
ncbi:hypothetical protein TRFO_29619 [Tritrichomonas foetus]|uniref:RRM domain-containing protein n=1 Tax=Tritrichomonas foetus TaxID=1144522 RepID=A0A1J4JZV1_9EUKA|nr:hypothetical protein TRFO_29619 [Tritrichomonas foetus]|eukprot:OHT03060.1 hypothetical protein TRFO_29619 [Tritrichomonas foetus]